MVGHFVWNDPIVASQGKGFTISENMSLQRSFDDGVTINSLHYNADEEIYVDMAGIMQVRLKESDGSISVKLKTDFL